MTEENTPPTPPVQPHRADRALRKFLFVAAALALFWIAFRQLTPLIFPGGAVLTDATTLRLEAVEAKLSALEQSIGDMQVKLDTLQAAPDQSKIETVNEKIAGMDAALQDLVGRVDAASQDDNGRLAAMTALMQLKETLQRGESFASALSRIKELSAKNAKALALCEKLAAHAEKGVAPLSALKSEFETAAPRALETESTGSLAANLRSLIRIRKVGEKQTGEDDESVVARAEAALRKDDLSGAAKELAALSPKAAETYAPWLAKAQAHLDARALADDLEVALTGQAPPKP